MQIIPTGSQKRTYGALFSFSAPAGKYAIMYHFMLNESVTLIGYQAELYLKLVYLQLLR